MPAALGTVPVALVPPFGAAPQRSSFANANGVSAYESLAALDTRFNYVPNPSFEYDLSGWAVYGSGDRSRSTVSAYMGSACCYVVPGTASANQGIVRNVTLPLGGGQTYSLSAYVRNEVGSRTWYIIYYYYDALGRALTNGSTASVNPGTAWTRIGGAVTAPQNTAYVAVYIAMSNAGSASDTGFIDAVMVERTPAGGAYFDGDTGTGYSWAGAGEGDATGNRMTANEASLEVDASGWQPNANCTLALSSAQAAFGSNSLLVTATSAASVNFKTVAFNFAVTPGVPYTMAAHVRGSVGARAAAVAFYWFRANGTPIGSSVTQPATTLPMSTTEWRRISATAVAPAEAATVQLWIVTSTGSVGDAFYADGFGFWQGSGGAYALPGAGTIQNPGGGLTTSVSPLAPTYRYNLLRSPGFESTGLVNNSNATITYDTATFYQGTQSAKIAVNVAGIQPSTYPNVAIASTQSSAYAPCVPGLQYTVSAYVKADRPGMYAFGRVTPFGGSQIVGANTAISDSTWTRVSHTFTIPAGRFAMLVGIHMYDPSGAYPSGMAIWQDAFLWEEGGLQDWFDGTSAGASWGAQPNQSVSIKAGAQAANVGASRALSDSLTVSDAVSSPYGRSRTVGDTVTLTSTLVVDVIFATLPVHVAGVGAGVSLAGAPGASGAQGNAGLAETLGDAGNVYASGVSNRVEAL